MDRRSFIGSLLVSGSGLILPTHAQALIMGDRYVRLVGNLKGFINKHEYVEAIAPNLCQSRDEHKACLDENQYFETLNHLMEQMLTDFSDKTPMINNLAAMQDKVTALLNGTLPIDVLSETDLRKYEDCIVIVGVTRYLMTVINAYIYNRPKLGAFTKLTDDYHYIVVR